MYGGVSLAIYIYGVARELFELVRATAARPDGQFVFPEVSGTAAVYRRLARAYKSPADAPPSDQLGCRFVVDIISGTSAGGLNGVCLAAALAGDREGMSDDPLGALEQLWIHEGDIARLIADETSTWCYGEDGEPRLVNGVPEVDPRLQLVPGASLLNGRRFYFQLADTMEKMLELAGRDGASRLVDELDLWVTATDLDGRRVELPLKSETVSESDHHVRFHFRYETDAPFREFNEKLAPFLGFVGRATSSFPGAFAPVMLNQFENPNEFRKPFYPAYGEGEHAHGLRTLSDGGILDNKPFTGATESLVERRAMLPVSRKLLYVEPDPGELKEPRAAWNALQTAQAALIGIPRSETIYADIAALLFRNRTIRRARDILALSGTDETQLPALNAPALEPRDQDEWWTASVGAMTGDPPNLGPTYATYHRLKVREVVDFLASTLAHAAGFPPDGPEWEALCYVIRAWKSDRYAEKPTPMLASENEFLFRFDLPYRTRRLGFILERLKRFELRDADEIVRAGATAGLEAPPPVTDELEERRLVAATRIRLTNALDVLVAVHRIPGPAVGAWLTDLTDRAGLLTILSSGEDNFRLEAARMFLAPREERFAAAIRAFEEACAAAAQRANDRGTAALGEPLSQDEGGSRLTSTEHDFGAWLTYLLRFHYDAFELFDLIYLPLSFGTDAARTNPVDVYRISPESSSTPEGVSGGLLGTCAGHFAHSLTPARAGMTSLGAG